LISLLILTTNMTYCQRQQEKTDTSLRVMEKKLNYILTSVLLLLLSFLQTVRVITNIWTVYTLTTNN